jgi:hypothetical protein
MMSNLNEHQTVPALTSFSVSGQSPSNTQDLTGKGALVIRSSRGLGCAVATRLVSPWMKVGGLFSSDSQNCDC